MKATKKKVPSKYSKYIYFFFKKETVESFLRHMRKSGCSKICFLIIFFFSVKGHVQNCKRENNTKETNGSSAKSSPLQSNSKKASGSGQGSSSAVQTAAGRKLRSFFKCLLSRSRSKMLYTGWIWNGMVYLLILVTVQWAVQVL